MDAAVARSDIRAISIRPYLGAVGGQLRARLGPWLRAPGPSESFWSYIDVYDLADALRLAAESPLEGHEAMYIAAADNGANRPLADLLAEHYPDVELRDSRAPDAGGISSAKAARLLGWAPRRSWRDYLSEDGTLLPEARERLARGETGVQRGRAALS